MTRHFWIIAAGLLATSAQAAHELDGRDLAEGAALYAEHCAACHGPELEGQPDWRTPGADGVLPAPPHDETGHTWHHDNQLLFTYTRLGGQETLAARGVTNFTSGMPAFGDLMTEDEIWAVLAFIRSTWPAEIRENHTLRNPPHD